MKVTLEKKENEAVFKCSLDNAEWEQELNSAYARTKSRYKIPGFRPGKASRKLIEMHYGQGVFFDAAVDACIDRAYAEQMSAHPELNTFGAPAVAFEKPEDGAAFAFSMTVTLYPEIKLGQYKGIKLAKIEYNVTDEQVEERIHADLHHASRLVKVERAAQNGDLVTIDYVGTVDGLEFAGGKASDYDLKLGSNTFIPGFEDQVVGMNAGEERDINVTFPAEYHAEELKGKAAVFHVTAKEVRVEEVPALDDEFVKERTKYATVEEYKAGLKADLEKAAKEHERSEKIDAAMKAITDNVDCKIPDKIVNAELDRMLHEMSHQLSHYGMKLEDYLKYNNSSVEAFRAERKESAELNVKMRLVMRAVIEAEKIDATDEEAAAKLESDAALRAECEAEAKEHGGTAEEYAKNEVITDKFFDFLVSSNEFVLEPEKEEKADKPEDGKKPAKKSAKKSTKKSEDK